MLTTALGMPQLQRLRLPVPGARRLWLGYCPLGDKGAAFVCANLPDLDDLTLRTDSLM